VLVYVLIGVGIGLAVFGHMLVDVAVGVASAVHGSILTVCTETVGATIMFAAALATLASLVGVRLTTAPPSCGPGPSSARGTLRIVHFCWLSLYRQLEQQSTIDATRWFNDLGKTTHPIKGPNLRRHLMHASGAATPVKCTSSAAASVSDEGSYGNTWFQ
jgi:hypothetical protein